MSTTELRLFDHIVKLIRKQRDDRKLLFHVPILNKVSEYLPPEVLERMVDSKIEKISEKKLVKKLDFIIQKSVKTYHPDFHNQLFVGNDMISLIAEMIIAHLNTGMYSYETAPVFTVLEKQINQILLDLLGWKSDESQLLWSPSGDLSHMMAMNLARCQREPESLDKGTQKKYTIYVSDQAHHSFLKGAGFLGFGRLQVKKVLSGMEGRMDPNALEEMMLQRPIDEIPLMIVATMGTPLFGSFDPIQKILKISQKYNIWLHVDASFGGGVLWSNRHREKLKGIEEADSITWNPSQMLRLGFQISLLFVKNRELVQKNHRLTEENLFPGRDKPYPREYDMGDDDLLGTRRVEVLKLWLKFKTSTIHDLSFGINKLYHLHQFLVGLLDADPEFFLIQEEWDAPIVCFWFWPYKAKKEDLEEIHRIIKRRMLFQGEIMISIQPSFSRRLSSFFRWSILHPKLSISHLSDTLARLKKICQAAYKEYRNEHDDPIVLFD